MKKIKITNSKSVFNFSSPYIIAEIGANHNGDITLAKKLIDSAKECGADAVKFQSWKPGSIEAKEVYEKNQSYNDGDGGKKHFGSLKEMVDKYYLRDEQHIELSNYCKAIGIDFCSTPFSKEEVDLLHQLDVPFFKTASMDINNFDLLKHMASYKKPIILSTGMSTIGEIERAIKTIEDAGNNQIIILHCISIYPPKYADINLNNILMLQKVFDYPIGFSDHSIGTSIPLASIALGSCVIEKHFTLDKDMPGWDHQISANPEELREIVKEGSNIQIALGSFKRVVSEDEKEKKGKFRRSVVTAKQLFEGQIIKEEDLAVKRPGTGIQPEEAIYLLGRKLRRNIGEDELLNWSDFE
ncbi:N-acetylneuraminate synthase family protein [Flavobacterium sp. GT3P67]|uniref:N-acetylneuraminate synthase family protein n=1 Tax=Flavobacterium sp. GT3P67 TaxID=2541722 RepID=UPI0010440A16|nr:N-acetylneuraminate synthase family protein [Flavobacterium sp. GT3P67]TDE51306.1 polysaccharide biosynthesis protein [Flavobacterium sp. GT3P67]